jgi:hypothetical protein
MSCFTFLTNILYERRRTVNHSLNVDKIVYCQSVLHCHYEGRILYKDTKVNHAYIVKLLLLRVKSRTFTRYMCTF